MFDYTVKTSKSLDDAVRAVEDSLREDNFGVLWKLDLTAKLKEKGMDFETLYTVLEVCNPKEAQRVLSENLLVGYFLPCKIVVYEDKGTTKIGLPKPTSLIQMIQNDEIQAMAEDIERRLISSIDKAI
ncbi:DUF302 domain-containing protein [Sporosarcina sp. P33]|uniref:DUF302 domain-containing protein n=1 Tax=Sporosarcina sp. P33 TaxID=1930764 RepID=UPI0009C0172D|nr:DUF302 domain-containing protein [Sporosarcina sp. P33]ARD47539.1 hypothetical protein SporoP33_04340 [Sporosarcina sp. P33]